MKYNTNEERYESIDRIIMDSEKDIGSIKAIIRNTLENKKGIEIKYLNVFFNATDEVFQILGIFTYYGMMFWVEKSNSMIVVDKTNNEFLTEVNDWIRCYDILNQGEMAKAKIRKMPAAHFDGGHQEYHMNYFPEPNREEERLQSELRLFGGGGPIQRGNVPVGQHGVVHLRERQPVEGPRGGGGGQLCNPMAVMVEGMQ